MHVIDYIRKTSKLALSGSTSDETIIELPAYHRGHLGFLPATGVHLGIHGEGHRYDKGCEVIISAYPSVTSNLAELSCTMEDSPGVVNKLLRALKSLDVNILVAETYSIKHNKRHHMELLFDWSTSSLASQQSVPVAFRSTVERLSSVVPPGDFRYLRLLGRILQCCSEDLCWKEDSRNELSIPDLKLRPFESRSTFAGTGRSTIVKHDPNDGNIDKPTRTAKAKLQETGEPTPSTVNKSKIVIALTDIEHDLRRILDLSGSHRARSDDQPLPYLMLSDTATRSLRVWFPQNDSTARQILHIGFSHSDISGALETITKILKYSQFNILTSLLRRGEPGQNVWEVHLQYEVENGELQKILDIADRRERLRKSITWLCKRISLEAVAEKWRDEIGAQDGSAERPRVADIVRKLQADLAHFAVRVQPPEYPKIQDPKALGAPFKWKERGSTDSTSVSRGEEGTGIAERRRWTRLALQEGGALKHTNRSWAEALAVSDGIPVPRLFLSYPRTARSHAKVLKDAIRSRINKGHEDYPHVRLFIDEFQEKSLQDISPAVLAMIRRADFFLGIWHSEKDRDDLVSPWMPYEYGVASAMGKPKAIIVRETIPKEVWGRIDPHIGRPEYNDLTFQEITVGKVIRHIEEEWLSQIPEDDRNEGMDTLGLTGTDLAALV